MRQTLRATLANFTKPHDVEHLRALEDAMASIDPTHLTAEDIKAVFDLYERFPDDDGYGLFWSLLHVIEAAGGYEAALFESVCRKPVEFNVMMVGRILNAGISQLAGHNITSLLAALVARNDISPLVRDIAQGFLANQSSDDC